MKITDFANVFMMILIAFFVVWNFKDSMNFNYVNNTEMINKCMDNAIVCALESGIDDGVDLERLTFNKEEIINTFLIDTNFFLNGNKSDKREMLEGNLICMMLTEGEGYYIYSKGEWSNKYIFSSDEHEVRVREIKYKLNDYMKELPFIVNIPTNNDEINKQTISDYSLIAIYKTSEYNYADKLYINCIISGAKLNITRS